MRRGDADQRVMRVLRASADAKRYGEPPAHLCGSTGGSPARRRKLGSTELLFHRDVRDVWSRMHWLHLEVAANASMQRLDRYPRAIGGGMLRQA
jgi:hypothetical protein